MPSHVINVKSKPAQEGTHVFNASFLGQDEREALGGGTGRLICTEQSPREVGDVLQNHGWREIRGEATRTHHAYAKRTPGGNDNDNNGRNDEPMDKY